MMGFIPEPLYGENNRPDVIPESPRTSYWYRTQFTVPAGYSGQAYLAEFRGDQLYRRGVGGNRAERRHD